MSRVTGLVIFALTASRWSILVNSTSFLSAQKSTPARPAGLQEKWCWNGMAPESCTKTPGFVIMNTLFIIISLVRDRSEFCSAWFIDHTKSSHPEKTHFVCLVLPISKHFIVSEGVDSGMLVTCCCRSVGGWVDQDMPIPLLHENRHRDLNYSSSGDGAGGGWWKTWTSHHLFISFFAIIFWWLLLRKLVAGTSVTEVRVLRVNS